jgi:hypothetical protein
VAITLAASTAVPMSTAQALDVNVDVDLDLRGSKVFNNEHRIQVRRYLHDRSDECPQGLVNQGGFCTPQAAERMWLIGRPLAKSVTVVPVPEALLAKLPRALDGHQYGFVNGDIVYYRTDNRLVLDAVVWSS